MLIKDFPSHCEQRCPIIVCKEKGTQHRAINRDRNIVFKYHVDGEIVTGSNKKRCDYLVENEDKKTAYLIELKGTDLPSAIEQIESSLAQFRPLFTQESYTVNLRIVYKSNSHAVNSPAYRKFIGKYGKAARIETNVIEENI